MKRCPECNGTGWMKVWSARDGDDPAEVPCDNCDKGKRIAKAQAPEAGEKEGR